MKLIACRQDVKFIDIGVIQEVNAAASYHAEPQPSVGESICQQLENPNYARIYFGE
jgi:hypothetical protein